MLYGLGMTILLLSLAFVGGEPTFPILIALVGAVLMSIGKSAEKKEAKRYGRG